MPPRPKINWEFPLREALERAEPRPHATANRADKKNYAERLSRELAIVIGQALRPYFPTVTPTAAGGSQESPTGADGGKKRLDVKVWDDKLGLVLSVSIKSYSFQDYSPAAGKLGRFTKNILRNDHELRAEADVVHRRQPFSVLIGIMFINAAAADDGTTGHSSFAHAVFTLRKRAGRQNPDDPRFDRFEQVFIGLFEPEGPNRGRVQFFDVQNAPPKHGRPTTTMALADVVDLIRSDVARRNKTEFEYEDGEPLDVQQALLAGDDEDL